MKKIAIFIASKNFEDEEYFIPLQVFSFSGVESVTFSDKKGTAIGVSGGEAEIEREIDDFSAEEFSAVVLVGGPGCLKSFDNMKTYQVLKSAVKTGCLIGAICIAPAVLANAGILEGVRSTVWSSVMDKSAIRLLKEKGAIYEDLPLVKDNMFITANGPQAAEEFARAVVSAI